MNWGRTAACRVLALACFFAVPSHAQESRESAAAAEALFNRGVALMEQGKAVEACPLLAESQKLDPGTGTLLALAFCYEKLGKTASAWATYLDAARLAQSTNQASRAAGATEHAKALEPNLAWLRIDVAEGARQEGLAVTRSASPVAAGLYGVEVPVDPGSIEVAATAPGRAPFKQTVTVGAGAHEHVEITPLAASSEPGAAPGAAPAPAAPDAASPASSSWNTQKTLAVVAGGVGLVSLGVGSFLAFSAKSKYDESNDGYCREGNLCKPHGLELRDDAVSQAGVATILVPLGLVGLGAGAALWFTAGSSNAESPPASAALSVSVGAGHAGADLRGTF